MSEQSQNAPSDGAPQLTAKQAIANLQQTQDSGDRYYAAWWIGRFRLDTPEAIEALLAALADDQDRDSDGGFPLKRNAARALGKVGGAKAIGPLIDCLDCPDYYVREAAAQALEALYATQSVPALIALLSGGPANAVPVSGKPYLTQPYNAILEALGTLGNSEIIPIVEPFLTHNLPQVKNAAARAMYQFTGKAKYAQILVNTLRSDDLQLRRSTLLDLGEVGYLPAAEAIANTLAENSIKLISLKGLLEKQLETQIGDRTSLGYLSEQTRHVMHLMDTLL